MKRSPTEAEIDTTTGCAGITCPPGGVLTLQANGCFCVSQGDASESSDASAISEDATAASEAGVGPSDASYDSLYVSDSGCPSYYACSAGYSLNANCDCEPCANSCPTGQVPGPGCNGCIACSTACPAGFDDGPSCGCVPHGTNPVPTPPADAGNGVTCLLEGDQSCGAGSWCEMGLCPDGTTQYGCYCNADGTATCSLTCPAGPSCPIPGHADCAPGHQCVYGSCASASSDALLICSCNQYGDGGTAYCYTASCADGGPPLPDAGAGNSGGVTCLLAGYSTCNAGSWCSLGTCPDGTTQYGCFCNEDGTATCNLVCPQPPPCDIPGEGTCPYGTSCNFGCGSQTGTGLTCYCGPGGSARCNTIPCNQLRSDGGE